MPSSSAKQSTHRVGMVSKIEAVWCQQHQATGESHAFGRAPVCWLLGVCNFAFALAGSADIGTGAWTLLGYT